MTLIGPILEARVRPQSHESIQALVSHVVVRGAIPILLPDPADPAEESAGLNLDAVPGPVIVCARTGCDRPSGVRPVLVVRVPKIGLDERRRSWRAALPDLAELAPQLAARYPIDPAQIGEIATDLSSRRRLGGSLDPAGRLGEVGVAPGPELAALLRTGPDPFRRRRGR